MVISLGNGFSEEEDEKPYQARTEILFFFSDALAAPGTLWSADYFWEGGKVGVPGVPVVSLQPVRPEKACSSDKLVLSQCATSGTVSPKILARILKPVSGKLLQVLLRMVYVGWATRQMIWWNEGGFLKYVVYFLPQN